MRRIIHGPLCYVRTMSDIIVLKREQRAYAKRVIGSLHSGDLPRKSALIALRIAGSACFAAADSVFAFSSADGEPELSVLYAAAARSGKHVFLPVCDEPDDMFFCDVTDALLGPRAGSVPDILNMPDEAARFDEAVRFTASHPSRVLFTGDGFKTGAYGIPEPDPAVFPACGPKSGAILLCPGLAFDKEGHRLGRGKGFFDRFLAGRRALFGSVCGVCFKELLLPSVAVLPHDAEMDQIFCDGE